MGVNVEIHTRQGITAAKYQHGLKEGLPLSCLMTNIVILMEHKDLADSSKRFENRRASNEEAANKKELIGGYNFGMWDKEEDGALAPNVSAQGFCDDNNKYNVVNVGMFGNMIDDMKLNI